MASTIRARNHPYEPIMSPQGSLTLQSGIGASTGTGAGAATGASGGGGGADGGFYLISKNSSRSSFFENNIEYEEGGVNVISYDFRSLFCHGCWDKSSPFNRRLMGILFLEVVISTTLGTFKCAKQDDVFHYCVPLPDNTTGLTLLTITSFLVGIFSNNVLQRWWSIRVALGYVINKSKSLAVAISSVVAYATLTSSPVIKEEALLLICKIYRYLNLAHALIYKNAEGNEDLSDLLARRLITHEESEILMMFKKKSDIPPPAPKIRFQSNEHGSYVDELPGSTSSASGTDGTQYTKPCFNPYNVYGWISLNLESAAAVGLLGASHEVPTNHIMPFLFDLGLIKNTAAEVGMYIGIQLPYEFAQMTVVIVYMFLVQLILVCGGLIGEGFANNDMSLIVTGYMTSVLMTFVMLSILNMYDVLSAKALSNLPTTTFMHEEEEQLMELCHGIWSTASKKNTRGNYVVMPNFSFSRHDVIQKYESKNFVV